MKLDIIIDSRLIFNGVSATKVRDHTIDHIRKVAEEVAIVYAEQQIKKLKEYAQHHDNCPQVTYKFANRPKCTCGLEQALNKSYCNCEEIDIVVNRICQKCKKIIPIKL